MNAIVSFRLYELFVPLVKEEVKAREIVANIEETKGEIKEIKAELLKWMFTLFLPFYIRYDCVFDTSICLKKAFFVERE